MKGQPMDQQAEKLPILEKLDLLVISTRDLRGLLDGAEKSSIISKLEKDTILKHFKSGKEQLSAFYLLLSSKPCPAAKIFTLLKTSGNENVASVFEQEEKQRRKTASSSPSSGSGQGSEAITSGTENGEWRSLQKLIIGSIDRLSSHTRNLGLVLCFASGIGLITGKDRETIANCSQLEIDQLKKFYSTVSEKEEDAYEKLLKVLKMTSNNWALHVLQINSESD